MDEGTQGRLTCDLRGGEMGGGGGGLKETLIVVNPYFSGKGRKTSELQSGGLWPPPASKVPPKPQVLSFIPHTPMLKVLGHVFQHFFLSCFC